jgi:hypothetical protein
MKPALVQSTLTVYDTYNADEKHAGRTPYCVTPSNFTYENTDGYTATAL